MTDLSPEVAEQVRQRIMHRTSRVDAMVYQYQLSRGDAEARYDAETAQLAETGELPEPPPSPDISGGAAEEPPVESDAEEPAAEEVPEEVPFGDDDGKEPGDG